MPVHTKIAKKIQQEIDQYLLAKSVFDSQVNLSQKEAHTEKLSVEKASHSEQGYMTLLSEGVVLFNDGQIRMYLTKGTLQKWYDSISDDYEGYVTVGHVDLNSFPVRQGYFRKEDLRIITDENGRSDLLVKPHINTELSAVKDLILQDEPFAISSEFAWTALEVGEDQMEEYEKLKAYNAKFTDEPVPITNDIDIFGFSFVGNPGNAKSGGYEPSILVQDKKELKLDKENTLDKILAYFNGTASPEKEEVVEETVEEPVAEETVVEEPAVEEVVEEQPEAQEEVVEEVAEPAVELLEKATAKILELEAKIASLEEEKAQLAKEKEDSSVALKQRMETLSALLTKATVEEPVEAKHEEKLASNTGLRLRFGGK